MAEVKWIKITTNLFDDEKIKIIDTYPARDEIIVIWFKLLTLAGKINENGALYLNNKIAYTTDLLSAIFNREERSIQLALSLFVKFGMIEIEDNQVINIVNWEKHQNIDGLEKIRLQTKERVKKHRDKKKKILIDSQENENVTCNVTVTESNATEEEVELEEEVDKDIKIGEKTSEDFPKLKIQYQEIANSYNRILGTKLTKVKSLNKTRKKKMKLRADEKLNNLEEWEKLFNIVLNSSFLLGTNKKNWKVTFDWLIENDNNYLKVLEGNYNNKPRKNSNENSSNNFHGFQSGADYSEEELNRKLGLMN